METHADHHPIQMGIFIYPGLQNQVNHYGLENPNIFFPPFSPPDTSEPPSDSLNPSRFIEIEKERAESLDQYLADEGLYPSPEDDARRAAVIETLKEIVSSWIKKVAQDQGRPAHDTSTTILTYGSYALGAHSPKSDIDAICIAPSFAAIDKDFFGLLPDMLVYKLKLSKITSIERAKVPLMRFKFDRISIDLSFSRVDVERIHEHIDILDPSVTMNIDNTSLNSLSGVRVNEHIFKLIPNLVNFQSMLRFLKLWAKRRGVYGTLHGYFGGVHLAVLAAFICKEHPNASLTALVVHFFQTFAFWPWPKPVMVLEVEYSSLDISEIRSIMPIQLPSGPNEFCHMNITGSTFFRIRTEFFRGYSMTWHILNLNFDWGHISEPFPYIKYYPLFVKISLSSRNQDDLVEWVGLVKSRFPLLLLMIEEKQGFCDPNPTEYVDAKDKDPNVVFYWGLLHDMNNVTDKIHSIEEKFMDRQTFYVQSPRNIKLSIVLASDLTDNDI